MVPSSSAHWAVGRTTSAIAAVSDRKMSLTTRKSSASSRSLIRFTSGAETTMLEASTSSARTPPSAPIRSSISKADFPGIGSSSASIPHTAATWARSAGSASLRYPGSWSAFWPCSRPPCPLPWPVMVP